MKAVLLFLTLATAAIAQDAESEAKLREALRATALQLRTEQTERANAQAGQAAAEARNEALSNELAQANERHTTLVKRASEDKAAADQTIATLNARTESLEKRVSEYEQALAQWKAAYEKTAIVAQTKENERAALAAESARLKNTLADRERKNVTLFNTAREILDRYEGHSLGKAIAAREPFIRTTRVQLENLVQGYRNQILDNRAAAPAQ
jgi:chromosome segregation ATPase